MYTQCPHCEEHGTMKFEDVEIREVDGGQIKFVDVLTCIVCGEAAYQEIVVPRVEERKNK